MIKQPRIEKQDAGVASLMVGMAAAALRISYLRAATVKAGVGGQIGLHRLMADQAERVLGLTREGRVAGIACCLEFRVRFGQGTGIDQPLDDILRFGS